MGTIKFMPTYLTWMAFSLDFCTAFLTTLWLYRIWQHTRASAHLYLWLGLGVFKFSHFVISFYASFFLSQNNPPVLSVINFFLRLFHFCSLTAIMIGLLLLEKDRIPRRQFMPEKIRTKLASNKLGGSPSSLSLVQKIAGIVLLIIAAAVAYMLIRASDPHTPILRIANRFMKSWVAGMFVCFWLLRLWQLTRDKAHLWLLAALLAAPAYGLIFFCIMKVFTPPMPLIGSITFQNLNSAFIVQIIPLICTIMALRTMACGAVSFREVFFPSSRKAE